MELNENELSLIERIGATHIYNYASYDGRVVKVYCKYLNCEDSPEGWYFYDGWGYCEQLPDEVNIGDLISVK